MKKNLKGRGRKLGKARTPALWGKENRKKAVAAKKERRRRVVLSGRLFRAGGAGVC